MSGPIWVQTVCKGYQQMTLSGNVKYNGLAPSCHNPSVTNNLGPDHILCDLDPNCLQSVSADN